MSADRKESEHTLQLGDCVHCKGQGFGKIVKVGRFFVEVLFTSGRRLQTCVGRPGKHGAGIADELRAVIDALPSKSVARNLASGVVIDHNAYGLGRVVSCTGSTVEIRFPKLNSTRRFLLADNIGLIVDLFGRSMGQCRTEITEPSGRKPLMKIVSRNLGLQARSTGGSASESDPSQRNTSSPSSRVRKVRATATVETNLPASARHIGSTETDGRTGRLSARLPREAPADDSSIPTGPNRAASTTKTERPQLAAVRRADSGTTLDSRIRCRTHAPTAGRSTSRRPLSCQGRMPTRRTTYLHRVRHHASGSRAPACACHPLSSASGYRSCGRCWRSEAKGRRAKRRRRGR